jgi:hypothetical protein
MMSATFIIGILFGAMAEHHAVHASPQARVNSIILKSEYNVTCVEWLDAKGELGWMTAEDYDPIARMISCGHLVSEDENFVVLAVDRSLEATPYYNNVGSIPRGMVQRQWRMK